MNKLSSIILFSAKVALMHIVVCSILYTPLAVSQGVFPPKGNLGPELSPINKMLGRWVQIEQVAQKPGFDALNKTNPLHFFYPSGSSEVTYSRRGNKWTVSAVLHGKQTPIKYSYQLGKQFEFHNFEGKHILSLIIQTSTTQHEWHYNSEDLDYVMYITRHVYRDLLIVVITIDDKSMLLTFQRKSKPC